MSLFLQAGPHEITIGMKGSKKKKNLVWYYYSLDIWNVSTQCTTFSTVSLFHFPKIGTLASFSHPDWKLYHSKWNEKHFCFPTLQEQVIRFLQEQINEIAFDMLKLWLNSAYSFSVAGNCFVVMAGASFRNQRGSKRRTERRETQLSQ